jgi:protein-S-isoprenylcysteine O-methyltransferase Ste14
VAIATTAAPPAPRSLAPSWFAAHLAAMVVLHFAWPVYQWNLGMTRWWGLPLAVAGCAVVVICARRFAPVTTLRPWEMPSLLVTGGLYRLSRNPMYAGMLLAMIGGVVMLGSLTPALAVPAFAWLLRTRFIAHEERVLAERFGDDYRVYRRRVRRWI